MKILIVLIILMILGAILSGIAYIKTNQKKLKTIISFKESLDLASLPIITFVCRNIKLNFLLDTGSTESFLASKYECLLDGMDKQTVLSNIAGHGGVTTALQSIYHVDMRYRSNVFEVDLEITEGLNTSFDYMKNKTGITVHGILGTKFLEKYKYVLDFKDYFAYQK